MTATSWQKSKKTFKKGLYKKEQTCYTNKADSLN